MQALAGIGLVIVPITFAFFGWYVSRLSLNRAWDWAQFASFFALAASIIVAAVAWLTENKLELLVFKETTLGLILQIVVSFIALVVLKFSRQYFEGEKNQQHYLALVQFTMASVGFVAISNHLVMFFIAWMWISLCLHQLLMFYPERPRAVLAAHKKFLCARLAESLLFIAFTLLTIEHGTFYIDDILVFYPTESVPWKSQVAAVLLGCVALIKCAQLPLHGWLIQVVENPTPISAVLHGGVINLGGFLLMMFGPLFLSVTAAQWLIVIVAGISTVLAALIMATRVSIKVRLAWSTSAQMGIMLIECALGLFELAVMHLVAHSCYKAYAFLASGSEVERYLGEQLSPAKAINVVDFVVSLVIAASLTGVTAFLFYGLFDFHVVSPWILMAIALTLLFAQRHSQNYMADLKSWVLYGTGLLVSYSVLKLGFAQLMPDVQASAGYKADLFVCVLLVVSFIFSKILKFFYDHEKVQIINAYLFAGLYLDEWATKVTLRLWPRQLPKWANAKKRRSLQ